MKRRILTTALAVIAALPMLCGSVSAKELVDSVPSVAEDVTAGEDITQGKVTEYTTLDTNETTYEADHAVTVYATATSQVVVRIPKTIIMGKTDEDGVFSGAYAVEVNGDIAGSQTVIITPEVTTQMLESGGKDSSDVAASATINGGQSMSVSANELLGGNTVRASGEVRAAGVSAGVWSCRLTFHVAVANE